MSAVIELQNVFKTYQMEKVEVHAVDGASFTIQEGDFAAISGPSGSGKSTLLNMIGLIDLPTKGKIIPGISVTDACLGWQETEEAILAAYEQLP